MPDIKNLKNILKVDNEEYNINAVHSDAATRVDNVLVIKQSASDKEDISFDGGARREVSVVPSTGGTYTGTVYVQPVPENEAPAEEQLVNYGDIYKLVENLTGFSCYIWQVETDEQGDTIRTLVGANKTEEDGEEREILDCASLIMGPESELASLAVYLTTTNVTNLPSYYLYICEEVPHNIYFGLEDRYVKLSNELRSDINDDTTISYTAETLYNKFNEIDNSLINTETRLTQNLEAEKIEIYLKIANIIGGLDDDEFNLKSIKENLIDIDERIEKIINGETTVANATQATNASYATADTDGRVFQTNYYRSAGNTDYSNTITISTANPSGGNPGDIWIKIPS